MESFQYYIEINSIIQEAEEYTLKHLDAIQPCVIFDVDQTAIDQYELMKYYDFGWFKDSLDAANTGINFPPIKETLTLYNKLKKYTSLIFLTSRREEYDAFTIEVLARSGYSDYTMIITRPDNDGGTIQDFKIKERQKLVDQGYSIIANIGDQETDLDGGCPGRDACFKLPNPFYLITPTMKCRTDKHEN